MNILIAEQFMAQHNLIGMNHTVDPDYIQGIRDGQEQPIHFINFMPRDKKPKFIEIQHITRRTE